MDNNESSEVLKSEYELVVIIEPGLGDPEVKQKMDSLGEKIVELGGSIVSTDLWGRRQLAYSINKKDSGTYVLFVVCLPNAATTQLERLLKLDEQVMRSLLVKKDKFAPDLRPGAKEENFEEDDADYSQNFTPRAGTQGRSPERRAQDDL